MPEGKPGQSYEDERAHLPQIEVTELPIPDAIEVRGVEGEEDSEASPQSAE